MSHHFDTPTAREDPRINVCDFYLFGGSPGATVMAMTVNPDAGVSAPETFRDEGLYAALSREPNLARARIGSPNSGSGCGSSSPRLESVFSEDAERAAGCEMALDVESVLDDSVNGQEALS